MKRFVTIIISCLCAVGMSVAQDLNITGAGARAEGLGGAFIGVADDATAIVWNPAGLTQLERAEASVVTRFIHEKAEFNVNGFPEFNTNISQSHVAFNFGSVALPFKLGSTAVVIAAAYQRQIDLYTNYKFELLGSTDEEDGKGGIDTFTPGLSIKLAPVFSIGAAANIWTGTQDLTSKTSSGFVNETTVTSMPYKGFNMVFGGLVDLEELAKPVPLKFGVTVRTPFKLTADGSVTVMDQSNPRFAVQNNTKRTVEMPLMLGFGASVRATENFTLAVDYELRAYKDKNQTDETEGSAPVVMPVSGANKNFNQFRAGAEYLIVAKNFVIPIRLGYKTFPTLLANIDDNGAITDQVSGKGLSFGSGFISNAVAVDVAYTMTDYTQSYGSLATLKFNTGTISASLIVYM